MVGGVKLDIWGWDNAGMRPSTDEDLSPWLDHTVDHSFEEIRT